MKKVIALGATLILTAGFLLVAAPQAWAACHIAAFESLAYTVNEGAGKVTLKVILQGGQPSCSGTVNYKTLPGTAEGGQDYTSVQGALVFAAADDRSEEISVPILEDVKFEGNETFRVELSVPSTPPQSITGTGGPATVTIADNDPSPPPAATSPSPKKSPSPVASPSPSPSATAAEEIEESPQASPVAEASESPSPLAQTQGRSGGGKKVAIIALLAALVAGGSGFGLWKMRRT